MSNLDPHPPETRIGGPDGDADGPVRAVLSGRDVVLGGIRGMPVNRTLPNKDRRMVGAWCFVDHYRGVRPQAMRVAPHPHTPGRRPSGGDEAGVAVGVLIGELGGARSPARAYTPIVGARGDRADTVGGAMGAGRRFGLVPGFDGDPLPAPELPIATLKPRGRRR